MERQRSIGSGKRIFFTSDSHWNHGNIIKYCLRPFIPDEGIVLYRKAVTPESTEADKERWRRYKLPQSAVDAHDDQLIENWNRVVSVDDAVFHLGDFWFGDAKKGHAILDRLNGGIYLVRGNHDRKILQLKSRFEWIKDYYELNVSDKDAPRARQLIVLFHYAMLSWSRSHHSGCLAFGHSHGSLNHWIEEHLPNARMLDVGVDSIAQKLSVSIRPENYRPISYEEFMSFLQKKQGHVVDHHAG